MKTRQNPQVKAQLQDSKSSAVTKETLTLVKILEFSQREIEQGKFSPAAEVFARVRASVS